MPRVVGRADVVIGADYGDEGKGKKVDKALSSGNYDVNARYNGGNNAGHTLYVVNTDGSVSSLVLNSIPSGVLHDGVINYIGSGCVVDPVNLVHNEIPKVEKFKSLEERLKISALATAITPVHIALDGVMGKLIGTTGKGIGPAYTSKAMRSRGPILENIRFAEIAADPKGVMANLMEQLEFYKRVGLLPDVNSLKDELIIFMEAVEVLQKRGFIEDDRLWLTLRLERGQNILMEGAQAYGLDVTYGAVPFVTSSSTFAGGAFQDVSPKYCGKITAVSKLIPSRVGDGPFVGEYGGKKSEIYCAEKDGNGKTKYTRDKEAALYGADELLKSDDDLEKGIGIRMKTGEYGATTGRPRRIARLDLKRLATVLRHTGADELVLTKLDCLDLFVESGVPVILDYQLGDRLCKAVPNSAAELYAVKPVVHHVEAPEKLSQSDQALKLEELPTKARDFVNMIQHHVGVKVTGLGIGPGRDDMVNLE